MTRQGFHASVLLSLYRLWLLVLFFLFVLATEATTTRRFPIPTDPACHSFGSQRVCNPDNILSAAEIASIDAVIHDDYEQSTITCRGIEYGIQFGVYIESSITVKTASSVRNKAKAIHNEWGVGYQSNYCGGTGILLYLAIDNHQMYFSRGAALQTYLTYQDLQDAMQVMKPLLRQNLYGDAIHSAIFYLSQQMQMQQMQVGSGSGSSKATTTTTTTTTTTSNSEIAHTTTTTTTTTTTSARRDDHDNDHDHHTTTTATTTGGGGGEEIAAGIILIFAAICCCCCCVAYESGSTTMENQRTKKWPDPRVAVRLKTMDDIHRQVEEDQSYVATSCPICLLSFPLQNNKSSSSSPETATTTATATAIPTTTTTPQEVSITETTPLVDKAVPPVVVVVATAVHADDNTNDDDYDAPTVRIQQQQQLRQRVGLDGKPLQLLPCGHVFNDTCIGKYLKEQRLKTQGNNNSATTPACPICFTSILAEPCHETCNFLDGSAFDNEKYLQERRFRLDRLQALFPNDLIPFYLLEKWKDANYTGSMAEDWQDHLAEQRQQQKQRDYNNSYNNNNCHASHHYDDSYHHHHYYDSHSHHYHNNSYHHQHHNDIHNDHHHHNGGGSTAFGGGTADGGGGSGSAWDNNGGGGFAFGGGGADGGGAGSGWGDDDGGGYDIAGDTGDDDDGGGSVGGDSGGGDSGGGSVGGDSGGGSW